MEEWRTILGFEDYEVSNLGRVRSLDRFRRARNGFIKRHPGQILQPKINKYGYCEVRLTVDGKRHRKLVHRLVCRAFNGEGTEERFQVAHFPDPTRTNNRAENLMWSSPAENSAHQVIHGTTLRGYKHPPEFGAKISAALKGRKFSDETKAKISKAHKGKKLDDAHKAQVLAAIRRYEDCPYCGRSFDIGNLPRHRSKCERTHHV